MGRNGITDTTDEKLLVGPGALYKNFVSWSDKGTLIGATKGGNSFDLGIEWHDAELDGQMGPTKGLKRIASIEPTLDVNLAEHDEANWLSALAGGESAQYTPSYEVDSWVGDGSQTDFTLKAPSASGVVEIETIEVWVDGTKQTLGATEDYTYDDATWTVTFSTAPAVDANITITYVYDSSGATGDFYKLTIGQITDSDFNDIALIGEILNSSLSNDAVIYIKNALAGNFTIDFNSDAEEENVVPVTFTGHFDPSVGLDLSNAPVEIWYPNA